MRQHRLGYPAPDAQPCSYDGCTQDAECFCGGEGCERGYCPGHGEDLMSETGLCVTCENARVRTIVAHGLTAGDFARRVTTK